jgi:hypothetical protein
MKSSEFLVPRSKYQVFSGVSPSVLGTWYWILGTNNDEKKKAEKYSLLPFRV